ncbi:DUF1254 domain-containing protein [Stenotrophobium rhamnosiphilum]|uniref:DUF1254 domain-containing protein n=1 Tax=Stenotrophobium rhamnosiphilum TaxID=2029166 RepID=UPI001374FA6F|nr:DUF1254 domain-containing protein [Stenotrophobium rhamnosiphilum]
MKVLKLIAVFILIAGLSNLATVAALPYLINAYVAHRIADVVGGYNKALHAPRPDSHARTVVRPSPDLLYTACAFDISEHPLLITAPVQRSYVSVSAFASDTSNFAAINDSLLQADASGNKHFNLVLVREGVSVDLPAGAQVIKAPSDKGLVLFRSLITDEAQLRQLQQDFQAQQNCSPL